MAESAPTVDLTADHIALKSTTAVRRYFAKFQAITGHLVRVAETMQGEGRLSKIDVEVLGGYVRSLAATFNALADKFLMTGRDDGPLANLLSMDRVESGFPIYRELLNMANDAQQAAAHLANMPSVAELKDQMVGQILGDLTVPTKLQFALSQRLYYQSLKDGGLFWGQNDPVAHWLGDVDKERRRYLLHWAVYDSQVNLPMIYLMEVDDTGRYGLPKDQRRWPAVQKHLMSQSVGGLKLLTIAQGFDTDFDDLHPKRLRRFHVGPMYSSLYTLQSGPMREILDDAKAPEGEDWALAWTVEELVSERVEMQKSGWFGEVEREIFTLDPYMGRGAETGASSTERAIILPERPYQVLAERNPAGFKDVRKFVVGDKGRVLSYR
jgi:hypothetical protein